MNTKERKSDMECKITGRNIEVGPDLKKYVSKRLIKMERLYHRVYGCEIILEEEKVRKTAEIVLQLKRNRLVAKESSDDIYTSIDNATGNMSKQLRRLSDKLKSKQRRKILNAIMKPIRGSRQQ